MQLRERKFGEIPVWARSGPITGKNYAYRAEAYCAAIGDSRGRMHPTVKKGMLEFYEWWQYFERHLEHIPVSFQTIIDEPHSQREFTVPELSPEAFDAAFIGYKGWTSRQREWGDGKTDEERAEYLAEMKGQLEEIGFPFSRTPRSVESPDRVRDRYGISRAQWNAIPDLPMSHEDRAANKLRAGGKS